MGGYYTGNGEIIFYHVKYIPFAIDFSVLSSCDISHLVLLYSLQFISFMLCRKWMFSGMLDQEAHAHRK